jgi:hypothetical protein
LELGIRAEKRRKEEEAYKQTFQTAKKKRDLGVLDQLVGLRKDHWQVGSNIVVFGNLITTDSRK